MPVELQLPGVPSVQAQKKRIVDVNPILYRSQNLAINGTEVNLSTLPIPGSGGVSTFTGTKRQKGILGYSTDAIISITQTQPVFLTLLSLDYSVSTGVHNGRSGTSSEWP